MTPEFQASMEKMAASTKTACVNSAKTMQATAKPVAANATATGCKSACFACHAKASMFAHSLFFTAGGVIAGIAAYYLVKKLRSKKTDTVEQDVLEQKGADS